MLKPKGDWAMLISAQDIWPESRAAIHNICCAGQWQNMYSWA